MKVDRETILKRIYAKTTVGSTDECWIWHGALRGQGEGYPHMMIGAHHIGVIRVMWEAYAGPLLPWPQFSIDHLCRMRHCINPWHLEQVPHRVNVLRGNNPTAANAKKTVCIRGHEFDAMEGTKRRCTTCKNMHQNRRYRERTKGK